MTSDDSLDRDDESGEDRPGAGAPPTESTRQGFRRIRAWRRAYWGSFFALMPVLAVAVGAVQFRGWWPVFAVPLALLALFAVAKHRCDRAVCPHCGELYFCQHGPLGANGTVLPLQRQCDSCDARFEV